MKKLATSLILMSMVTLVGCGNTTTDASTKSNSEELSDMKIKSVMML